MKALFLTLCVALLPFSAKAETGVTHFAVSGPIMVLESKALWGLNFLGLHGVTENVEVGGQTGFFLHSANGASTWVVPVLPTLLYHFDVANAPTFSPFAGLGLGIGLVHSSASFGDLNVSGTDVDFMGLAHLGARMGATQRFFADIQLGLLSDSFVFMPSVGWMF